jgi:hypothetical protein
MLISNLNDLIAKMKIGTGSSVPHLFQKGERYFLTTNDEVEIRVAEEAINSLLVRFISNQSAYWKVPGY